LHAGKQILNRRRPDGPDFDRDADLALLDAERHVVRLGHLGAATLDAGSRVGGAGIAEIKAQRPRVVIHVEISSGK
ncbi:MAG: hypothetical protein PHP66_02680, partial [Syntrophales bacterium]|nr:hypothetical protein [Syntrophales bacterium]